MIRLIKSFSVYAFTIFFNAVISFLTLWLLTHYLSDVDYGIINLYSSFTILLVPFIAVGVPFTLGVDYFRFDKESYRGQFTNAVIIPLFSSALITVLFLFFYHPLHKLLKVDWIFIMLLPASCLVIVMNEIMLGLMRNKGKHFLFAGYQVSRNLFEVGLTIALIVGMGLAWRGRLISALTTLLISDVVIYFLIRRWDLFAGTEKLDKIQVKKTFRIGLPFIPERLAIFVLAYSDRFFIDHYNGTGNVGYYGTGAQVAMIVNLVILTLVNSFHPYIYKKLSQQPADYRAVKKALLTFMGIAAIASIVIIAATPFLFKYFIGPAFQRGQKYAFNLTIGFFFWSIYNAFIACLLFIKKNKVIMSISITGMLLSIGLNFYNVSHFGAIGATYSSMIVYATMSILVIFFVHRYYDLRKLFGSGKSAAAI